MDMHIPYYIDITNRKLPHMCELWIGIAVSTL